MNPHHHNRPITVLLADRSPFGTMVLRTIVEMAGYRVIGEADDGTAALELYRAHSPSLALVDHDLTTSSGENAAMAIMAHDPGAAVILCGRSVTAPEGITGVLGKPYDPEKVCTVLHGVTHPLHPTNAGPPVSPQSEP